MFQRRFTKNAETNFDTYQNVDIKHPKSVSTVDNDNKDYTVSDDGKGHKPISQGSSLSK